MGTGLREHELLALDVGDVFDDAGLKRRVAFRDVQTVRGTPSPGGAAADAVRPRTAPRRRKEARRTNHHAHHAGLRAASDDGSRRASSGTSSRSGGARRLERHVGSTRCATTPAAPSTAGLEGPPALRKFARHKSVVTTSIYTHPTDDELLRAVQGSSAEPAPRPDHFAEQNRTRACSVSCSAFGFESQGLLGFKTTHSETAPGTLGRARGATKNGPLPFGGL